MSIEVKAISSKKDIKRFIDFPHRLYKGDSNYVPEIYIGMKDMFNKKKNPFFLHSETQEFLAYKDNKIVGRISAILNNNYNKHHNSNVGFFGFYDVIDDYEVSKELFDNAVKWVKSHGVESILGPVNFSTNDTAAMLIEPFDRPPIVMMAYNKPYYPVHAEKYGFIKDMDLLAYMIYTDKVSDKSIRLSELIEQRLKKKGITIREINMKNLKSDVDGIKKVYNSAWEDNWGFVPSTDEEFNHMADDLKMIVNPEYTYVAEKDGEMIGFMIALPNINEIMINVKRGRLFPTGIIKLLMGKKKTKYVRIVTLGVIDKYRKMGIEAIFYATVIKAAKRNNLIGGEASWILENNTLMNAGIEKLNGELYKRYRIYKKDI